MAVTLGEIQAEVEITREQDAAKVAEIEAWPELVPWTLTVLAADGPVFRDWARLMHGCQDRLIEDALIAASALAHGLTVETRNVKDFRPLGVAVLDPFAAR
jgi:predicted nucleic acid-binding protein